MWLEADRRARARWWNDVERLIALLPAPLFRQAKLLEYELALRYAPTGQFRDVFSGSGMVPVLAIGPWLHRDLGAVESAASKPAQRHLFVAAFLLAARAHAVRSIPDPDGFATDERLGLVQWLSDRAAAELAMAVGDRPDYWPRFDQIAQQDAAQLVDVWQRRLNPDPLEPSEAYLDPVLSGSLAQVGAASAAVAGREEAGDEIGQMLDHLARAFQIRSDLASLQRDAERGHLTFPVAVVARAAGLRLRPFPRPEVILGAMAATGSVVEILESEARHIDDAQAIAASLSLATTLAFLTDARERRADDLARLGDGLRAPRPADTSAAVRSKTREPASEPLAVVRRPNAATLSKALAMAQAFLLSDRTFRESWEVHREGMLGRPEVTSRFPAGLALEILRRHGLAVGDEIDGFLDFTAANAFRYYDHPESGVDSDTLGVWLRLAPHGSPAVTSKHAEAVSAAVACLERAVQADGAIPVWIARCDASDERSGAARQESQVIALGEGCATVAANLVMGLTARGAVPEALLPGIRKLVHRIGEVGLGANVNYPPLYALSTFFRVMAALDAAWPGFIRDGERDHVLRTLRGELERARAGRFRSTQDAALLVTACHDAEREGTVDPNWITRILKGQRFDGSWAGEPFAAAPNRGRSVTWYASSLLTSALCFDALAQQASSQVD